MSGLTSVHQLLIVVLLFAWLLGLVAIWVRYEQLPHGKFTLIALLLWPTLLVDEVIRAFTSWQAFALFTGVFNFVPILIALLICLSVRKLVLERPVSGYLKYFAICLPVLALQIPILMQTTPAKLALLQSPPTGHLSAYWPIYALYFYTAVALLLIAIWVEEMIADYQYHLSEQVVDINYYKMPITIGLFGGLITVAFAAIVLTTVVAFNLLAFAAWQSVINLLVATMLLLLIGVMLEKRRYAPSPLEYGKLDNHSFSQEQLRDTLTKAEQAIIKHKAYKRIGLRIRQLADAAEVEPQALAVATHQILNRNFRAFIYHYRLEYAKKVLMRTDTKVSHVAKKLGFNSEKFLSGVFVKYIRQMGKENEGQDLF